MTFPSLAVNFLLSLYRRLIPLDVGVFMSLWVLNSEAKSNGRMGRTKDNYESGRVLNRVKAKRKIFLLILFT